jgi:GT2 family glycosyltransferase
MKKSFCIGIPTINRADLLIQALSKYSECYPNINIFIIDNGSQGLVSHDKIEVETPSLNLGVAASWNRIIEKSIACGHTHTMILNDDIELCRDTQTFHNLINEECPNAFIKFAGTWCSFILPNEMFNAVGPFDTNFYPAYFEDNDYSRRIQLKGFQIVEREEMRPTLYRNSMTIARDPALNQNFDKNRHYYIYKWGGEPNKELYETPFNQGV